MTELLSEVVEAHGGIGRWSSYKRLAAELSIGGHIWQQKRQPDLLDTMTSVMDLRQERVSMRRRSHPRHRMTFSSSRVTFEEADANVVESCYNPRSTFSNQSAETPWNEFQVAYFSSSAVWTSLVAPFLYTYPGFYSEELEPCEFEGEVCRRLRVTFPDSVVTHTREQIAYFGPDGLLRRCDNVIEVLDVRTVNRASAYKDFQGIRIPTVHEIFYDKQRTGEPSGALVQIRISDVSFS
jgi:hypothetical protein